MTIPTDLPEEAVETLRAIYAGDPDVTPIEPMLNFLVKEGYVESVDGVPTLTESGTEILNSADEKAPDFLFNNH